MSTINGSDFLKKHSSNLVPKVHHDKAWENTSRVWEAFKARTPHDNTVIA